MSNFQVKFEPRVCFGRFWILFKAAGFVWHCSSGGCGAVCFLAATSWEWVSRSSTQRHRPSRRGSTLLGWVGIQAPGVVSLTLWGGWWPLRSWIAGECLDSLFGLLWFQRQGTSSLQVVMKIQGPHVVSTGRVGAHHWLEGKRILAPCLASWMPPRSGLGAFHSSLTRMEI